MSDGYYTYSDMPGSMAERLSNGLAMEDIIRVDPQKPVHPIYPTLISGHYWAEKTIEETDSRIGIDFSVLNHGQAIIINGHRLLGPLNADSKKMLLPNLHRFFSCSGAKTVYMLFGKPNTEKYSMLRMTMRKDGGVGKITQYKMPLIVPEG